MAYKGSAEVGSISHFAEGFVSLPGEIAHDIARVGFVWRGNLTNLKVASLAAQFNMVMHLPRQNILPIQGELLSPMYLICSAC